MSDAVILTMSLTSITISLLILWDLMKNWRND